MNCYFKTFRRALGDYACLRCAVVFLTHLAVEIAKAFCNFAKKCYEPPKARIVFEFVLSMVFTLCNGMLKNTGRIECT